MSLSLELLERHAAETGFPRESLEKVVRLGEIAAELGGHPLLGKALALKGGTALNLCFGVPQRLSVDLDFNYVGELARAAMLEQRPSVERALEHVLRRLGYQPRRSRDEHAGRKFHLEYRSAAGPRERIQVDLNFLARLPLEPPERREMWLPGERERPRLPVLALEEIVVGKLLALLDRAAVRDAYDATRLPAIAGDLLASQRFRSWFVALSAVLDHPLGSYDRARLEARLPAEKVEADLRTVIRRAERVEAGDLVERAWQVVAPLLRLTPAETQYTLGAQYGELRLELLFPDQPEEAKRLAPHPALQWKIANARQRVEAQGRVGPDR